MLSTAKHSFAHCPLSKKKVCGAFSHGSLRRIYFSIHPCGHTVTSSARSRPDTHLLPPTCLLLLHVIACCVIYFRKGYSLLPGAREMCGVEKRGGLAATRKSAERLVREPLNVSLALLSGSVQRYALFLRVLSGCHSAPIFPVPPLVAHRGWKLSNEVRSTLKGSSLPGL